MAERPARLWKDLPPDTRVEAAEAFWRDDTSPEVQVQQMEATLILARRLNFRPKSVLSLSIDRRARHLAQVADVSDAIATRALIAYHFAAQRPLMAAFLDALGIRHEDGLIAQDDVAAPDRSRLTAALESVRTAFPPHAVDLYAKTLAALDGDTWRELDGLVKSPLSSGT